MGGDHGPEEVVPGAIDHAREHPEDRVLLVGDEATIRSIGGELPTNVEIVHASQVVEMDEHPAKALREKKDSTILVATDLVKNGRADALVTAGHTGAGTQNGISSFISFLVGFGSATIMSFFSTTTPFHGASSST